VSDDDIIAVKTGPQGHFFIHVVTGESHPACRQPPKQGVPAEGHELDPAMDFAVAVLGAA
jgi:hypothetical protein